MYERHSKRRIQGENTKKNIADAALKLFYQRNFDDVTIEDIVAQLGLSVGAFYHHFKNKQAVLEQIFLGFDVKYQEYYESVILAPQMTNKGTAEKLENFMLATVGIISEIGVDFLSVFYRYAMTSRDNNSFVTSLLDFNRPFYRILREMITEGQSSGEINNDISVNQIIWDLTIIARGSEIEWCLLNGSTDIRSICQNMFRNYIKGISASDI